MCRAQVHMVTALKKQSTVVDVEKWEHLQFQHMHWYQHAHDILNHSEYAPPQPYALKHG